MECVYCAQLFSANNKEGAVVAKPTSEMYDTLFTLPSATWVEVIGHLLIVHTATPSGTLIPSPQLQALQLLKMTW